jgi:hypothetical protein
VAQGSLTLKGSLEVGDFACATGCPPAAVTDRHVLTLLLKDCGKKFFQSIVETPVPLRIATTGAVGAEFQDLDLLAELDSIELLFLRTNAPILARIGAAAAVLAGTGGTFPTTFAGGETFTLTIDGTAVAVTFTAAAQSAQDVANEINGAAAIAGLPTPRASVAASGQLQISSVLTGAQGTVVVTGGTGAGTIGYAGTPSATGDGEDVPVDGIFLAEFGREGGTPAVPTRVQISGQANVTVLAAGTAPA